VRTVVNELQQAAEEVSDRIEDGLAPLRLEDQEGKGELQHEPPSDYAPGEPPLGNAQEPGKTDHHEQTQQADELGHGRWKDDARSQ
jgi:hypothetical protein